MRDALVEVQGVARVFPGKPPVHALRDANLTLSPGEIVAVVGSSGSGKSTLLNILGLLDEPTSGTMLIGGEPTSALAERRRATLRARTFGFVFQAFHLVPYLDCVANVTLPLVHQGAPARSRRDMAVDALDQVGMGHRLAAKPTTLSGGEQQRVAIARAIVHSPRVVLCDEPTGNLDSENTLIVLTLLRGLLGPERAVVVVTHEHDVRDCADRIVEVSDGRCGAHQAH